MADPLHIIVPARLASTRLPNKPLADIAGRAMICRVLDRALEAVGDKTLITAAVDSEKVLNCVRDAGYHGILTDPDLPSGSDRIAAAAKEIGLDDDSIIINLQGDEPAMPSVLLSQIIQIMQAPDKPPVATLAAPGSASDLSDPNVVKTVMADNRQALYFSRASIPYYRDASSPPSPPCLRHIGLYAYRFVALKQFVSLPPHPLEIAEKLEQLRFLGAGIPIRVGLCEAPPHGVDTPAQLAVMRKRVWG